MKKYFKLGLATIIPVLFVALILNWLYGIFNNLMLAVLPVSLGYQWWYAIVFVIALVVAIVLVGFFFSFIKPARWAKRKIEDILIKRIPLVNNIYSFGLEVSDALIEDGKFDGKIKVVETIFAGELTLGMLTDEKNNLIFIPTVPNPMNGFLIKKEDYKITKLSVEEMLKIYTSLGKIGGYKWE